MHILPCGFNLISKHAIKYHYWQWFKHVIGDLILQLVPENNFSISSRGAWIHPMEHSDCSAECPGDCNNQVQTRCVLEVWPPNYWINPSFCCISRQHCCYIRNVSTFALVPLLQLSVHRVQMKQNSSHPGMQQHLSTFPITYQYCEGFLNKASS